MRSSADMIRLILDIAHSDEDILALFINGSRANINAPIDIYQDYDIVYVVRDTAKYYKNDELINKFGEILYMQCPPKLEMSIGKYFDVEESYNWLMQLSDGNRVDLTIMQLDYAREQILEDKLCLVLLDKDNYLPPIPKSTDEDFWVKQMSADRYIYCCNEFWWCLNNITKGLKRGEVLYTQDMLNHVVRPQLITMLSQYAGILTKFSVSMGKSAKYLSKYLPDEMYDKLLSTYSGCDVDQMWENVDTMCKLFFDASELVAVNLGFTLNVDEANASYKYFSDIRNLPANASEIYPN